jgi:hypothetical protein
LWLARRQRTPLFEAAGFWLGNLHEKATIEAGSTLVRIPRDADQRFELMSISVPS